MHRGEASGAGGRGLWGSPSPARAAARVAA
jgi:hypothetical protein